MNCDQARETFTEYVISGINPETRADCREHLAMCEACRQEWSAVRGAWDRMEALPEMEPGPELRSRFYQMLEAYEAGRRATVAAKPAQANNGFWSFLRQPAFQFAGALAMLAVGVAFGYFGLARTSGGGEQVTQLRNEVQNMRQLVTLSLLQQQSAADRLQGVTWSYRVSPSDTEVLSALLTTVNHDDSVDVRLSAIDALKSFNSPVARRGLAQALAKQSSPLVEVAIVDALVDLKEKTAAPVIQSQLNRTDLDPTVRKRLEAAARQLE